MRLHLILYIAILSLFCPIDAVVCPIQAATTQPTAKCKELEQKCEQARSLSQYPVMETCAKQLIEEARHHSDLRSEAYAQFYYGLSLLFQGHASDAISKLDEADRIATQIGQDSVLALSMNTRAIYYVTIQNNNLLAQECFFKSLDLAKKANFRDLQIRVQGNLLTMNHASGGAIQKENAQEVYDYGCRHNKGELISLGSYYLATYYLDHQQFDQAETYVNIALDAFNQFPTEDIASVYSLAAKLYIATGNIALAEEMAEKALQLADKYKQSSIMVDALITYAEVLTHKGEYDASSEQIRQALSMIDDIGLSSKYAECNQLMALNMNAMSKVVASQRIALLAMLITLVVLVTSIILGIIVLQRRRKLYRSIVLQNTHAVQRQKELEQQLDALSKKSTDTPTLGENKVDDLYTQLCRLMDAERPYTEPQLTREKLAEQLGTNRTYLTTVIKEKTGMSYLQFVNSYRINEAIRIMSDKDNLDYPLKRIWSDLGFSSPSTFYKVFQQTVGITPSTYRKQFIEASKQSL